MQRLYLSAELRADLRARGLRNASECSWERVFDSLWPEADDASAEADVSAYRSFNPSDSAGVIAMDLA